jgi:hypothetical protein
MPANQPGTPETMTLRLDVMKGAGLRAIRRPERYATGC